MSRYIFVPVLIILMHLGYSQNIERTDFTIGDRFQYNSKNLQSTIELFIGLPRNYHESNCKYPVHYVLDGQIIFSYYFGVTDMLTKGEIPECIVVGIQSFERGYFFKPGDGAAEFTKFLTKELIPFIDNTYRTNDFRLIVGHSTTGAFIVNTLLNSPDPFDVFMAGAPYHSDLFLRINQDSIVHDYGSRKYFYSFYGLNDNQKEKSNWDSLAAKIKQVNIKNLEMINKEYEEEGHYSIIYRYIPDGLKMAFKDWGYLPARGEKFSYPDFLDYPDNQQIKFGVIFNYSEGFFIGNAVNLVRQGDTKTAFKLLDYGLNVYPNSEVLLSILAKEYEEIGEIEIARKYYTKMLEINPDSDVARQKLKDLD